MKNIKRILELRSLIARLGEKDLFGWWDSEALTSAGCVVLSRLFPKTGVFAGIGLSIEAARITHNTLVNELEAITLFNLPQIFEKAIESCFIQFKQKDMHSNGTDNGEEGIFKTGFLNELEPPLSGSDRDDIGSILVSSGLLSPFLLNEIAPKKKGIAGRLVCIGELKPGQEPSADEYVHYLERLTAAYTFSSPGCLVVPYYLIKRR